jgi:tungstate transport system ATP-binding protein
VLLRRSAAANIRYALRAHGVNGAALKARTRDWLERADLLALADQPARVLSGGEQQRLAIARALSHGPEVLFLDEPTASLDPASTIAIERLVQAAHTAGTKIVLVTHDLGQARRFADEVIFLYRGRVEEVSPAGRFFVAARSAKARAFLEGRIVL